MSAESIQFRAAVEADLGAMALVMECANALRDGRSLPASIENDTVLDDLHSRMHKEGAWTHVAADQKRIAGFMVGYPYSRGVEAPVDPTKEYLSLLMIDPDYWGKGIAGRLLDIAASRARQADKQQLLLWTRTEDNERAKAVYERKGYVVTGSTRISQHGYGLQVQYALDL